MSTNPTPSSPSPSNEAGRPAAQTSLDGARTAEAFESWLVLRMAEILRLDPADIDPGLPFSAHGLESLDAFNLAGEISQSLGREMSATLLWEYLTAEDLARHLAQFARDEVA